MVDFTFDNYWRSLEEEVSKAGGHRAVVTEMPLRSTEGSTGYNVWMHSTGGFKIFAHYSVPKGDGPFPGLFMAPGYGSVVAVPSYERRQHFVVLALSARGQRLSDDKYASEYPGLLTDRIEDPYSYPYRGMVADCLTAIDFLRGRPEVDSSRLGISGADLAFIAAGLRSEFSAALIDSPVLFRDTSSRFSVTTTYPLEELNDYLRAHPDQTSSVRSTLELFDPLNFTDRIKCKVFVTCSEGEKGFVNTLVGALGDRAEFRIKTGRGYLDHVAEEAWLKAAVGL